MAPATKKKVVWVGDSKSGKTCLTGALYGETLVQRQYDPTVFDNKDVVFATQVGQEEVEVQVTLSDTSGDEGYDRLRPLSYLDTDLIVLCYSVASPSSLRSIPQRWQPELRHHLPSVPILLVGAKTDLREKETQTSGPESGGWRRLHDGLDAADSDQGHAKHRCVTFEQGKLMSLHLGAERHLECSALSGEGLQDLRETIFDILFKRDPKIRWKKAARLVRM